MGTLGAIYGVTILPGLAWGGLNPAGVAAAAFLAAVLATLSAFDVLELRLPDALTLPLVVAGVCMAWWLDLASPWWRAASALIGYLVLAGLAHAYRRVRGRAGLGRGDAKLFAASGAWVGAEALALVLLCASVTALVSIMIAWMQGSEISGNTRIPYGPFLALGTWLVWLYGPV
jgi:leader peptidase (prepilin peptidase) / N-methyltransferase